MKVTKTMRHSYEPLTEASEIWTTDFRNVNTIIGNVTMTRDKDMPLFYESLDWPQDKPCGIPPKGVANWSEAENKWVVTALKDWIPTEGCCGGK